MKYNPEIHHRKSIRLKGYDYSQPGKYFTTINVKNRKCLFGKIVNGKMILNDAGKIADFYWMQIPEHFPDALLHEHIVMPNHIHGIIEITKNDITRVQNSDSGNSHTGNVAGVENSQPLQPQPKQNKYQKIIPRSVGSIVRGFKIGVTNWFNENQFQNGGQNSVAGVQNFEPLRKKRPSIWQRNFHERIIRDEQSFKNISNYIKNNPQNWKEDNFFNE